MSQQRLLKVNSLIQKEISQYWEKELEFPPNVLVSVTRVETTKPLDKAFVYISIWPADNDQQDKIMNYLQKNVYQTQKYLDKRLSMRRVPKIVFEIDQQAISRREVEDVLDSLPNIE